jgi:hypothetical protein
MRKEYDLRSLKVKRRGVMADAKAADAGKTGQNKPATHRKSGSGYVKRAHR